MIYDMAVRVSTAGKRIDSHTLQRVQVTYLTQLYAKTIAKLSSSADISDLHVGEVKRDKKYSVPKYNYGLSGSGKLPRKRENRRVSVPLKGEVLFGTYPVQIALSAEKRICHRLFIKRDFPVSLKDIVRRAEDKKVEITCVTRDILFKLSGDRPNNGVCMDVSPLPVPRIRLDKDMEDLWSSERDHPLWLLLYNVKDPMNFGAVLRSSYFLGVDRIIIPEKKSSRLSPVVSKASAGALEVINMSSYQNFTMLKEFLQVWKGKGGRIIGTSSDQTDKTKSVHEFEMRDPTLLIIGNEEKGIHESVMDDCDILLNIASNRFLHSAVDSLNVSVATGIILHSLKNNR